MAKDYIENIRRTWPTESIKKVSYRLTETEMASMCPEMVCTEPSEYMLWPLACCFWGLLLMRVGMSLTILSSHDTIFLLLDFLVHPPYEGFCLVLSCPVLSCFVVVSWRPALF